MKNKILCLVTLALFGGTLLTGCGDTPQKQEDIKELKQAMASLQANEQYLIQTVNEMQDNKVSYLEVVNDNGSYTEYPVDSEGNFTSDTIKTEEEQSDVSYQMMDWLDKNGEMYMTSADADGNAIFYSLPKDYAKKVKSRNVGYFDKMVDNFTEVTKLEGTKKGNIGDGEETFTMYECKLPAEDVKDIMGVSTYGLYDIYAEDAKTDKSIKKLCEFYLDDLDMSLTFSDANVTVSVADGKLRQLTMEMGGLGTKMYVTKTFLLNGKYDAREKPDFSSAVDFKDSLKELADFVKDYDSYGEAMEALNNTVDSE